MSLFHGTEAEQREAAGHCFTCPAFENCQRSGQGEDFGVWGGITEYDRAAARAADGADMLRPAVQTERKRKVAELKAEGLSLRQIAALLGVSHQTVKRDSSGWVHPAAA